MSATVVKRHTCDLCGTTEEVPARSSKRPPGWELVKLPAWEAAGEGRGKQRSWVWKVVVRAREACSACVAKFAGPRPSDKPGPKAKSKKPRTVR